MSDEIQISQAASLASGNTQIGVQNTYNGISVEKATRVLMDVFLDNFPKLQRIAMETAKARAEEICQKLCRNWLISAFMICRPLLIQMYSMYS